MTNLMEAPHFGVVKGRLGFTADLERTCAFIDDKGMNERVAVQAFHGHYPQGSDERVLEFADGEVLRTRVATSGETADLDLVPTVVGFMSNGTRVTLRWGIEVPDDGTFESDLRDLGRFLVANGLTDTFVVVRLPLAVAVIPGETVLLEKTDESTRTQASHIQQRGTVSSCCDGTWVAANGGAPVAIMCCQCEDH